MPPAENGATQGVSSGVLEGKVGGKVKVQKASKSVCG
jgi:hypothetical protein